ncbi:MAG: hypothetical protein HYY34_07680, partial [Chloroflexi bacterium]|nr:hypothetical protein [Chloroflexota bacterium]
TVDPGAADREAVRGEAAPGRPTARRTGGRGRARSVIDTEFLRQELLKFVAVTLVLIAVVVVAAIFYK